MAKRKFEGVTHERDMSDWKMRRLLPYGSSVGDGVEELFNRDYETIAVRKPVSLREGFFFNDSCSPWAGYEQPRKDCEAARLRCEAVMYAWINNMPLDRFIFYSYEAYVDGDNEGCSETAQRSH